MSNTEGSSEWRMRRRNVAEKLTPDGHLWRDGTGRPYVWLPRAQALADALEACKAERDALRKELQTQMKTRTSQPDFVTFVNLKHGIVGTILAALQDGQISRGKAAEALAEVAHGVEPRLPDDLPDPVSEDVVPSDVLRERDKARRAALLADARRAEVERERDKARARAEAAEQREARLREIGDRLAQTVLLDDGSDLSFMQAREVAQQWQALADAPAAPAAEPQPAPAALDPALREPLTQLYGDQLEPCFVDADEANARIAALWRWIDGEPQRTAAAVSAEADAWRAMLADPARARLASCHRGREVTLAVDAAVAAKLRQIADNHGSNGTFDVHIDELLTIADGLAPPPQQGGTEGREK